MGKNLKGIVVLLLVLVLLCSCATGDMKAVKLDKKTQEKIEEKVEDYVNTKLFSYCEAKYEMTVIEKPLEDIPQDLEYFTNCYWICVDFDKTKQDSELARDSIETRPIVWFLGKEIARDDVKTLRYILQYTISDIDFYTAACITTDGEVLCDNSYTELFDEIGVGNFNEYFIYGRK